MTSEEKKFVHDQYQNILSDLRSARLIAVSKKQDIEKIKFLYELGQRDFAENYVQELIEKASDLKQSGYQDIVWHLIGHLQKNKIKSVLPYVSVIHSIDSIKTVEAIEKNLTQIKKSVDIFVQINVDDESNKGGIKPEEAKSFCKTVSQYKNIHVLGLMCIPDPMADAEKAFSLLSELEKKCKPYTQGFLSMGMSSDYKKAIKHGATHVRIGTLLFGGR